MNPVIELHDISFEDEKGKFDLRYPKYPDLIDYSVVDASRGELQPEPAFHFLNVVDDEAFEFRLQLSERSEAVFARTRDGGASYSEASLGPGLHGPIEAVELDSDTACKVRVRPANWGTAPAVLVLRIFCKVKDAPTYDREDGISIAFLRSGGVVAKYQASSPVAKPESLEVVVTQVEEIAEGVLLAKYNIFRDRVLPAFVGVEPCFRVGPTREIAKLKITLAADLGLRFAADASTGDDVCVIQRGIGPRAPELSKVVRPSDRTIQFSWKLASGGEPRVYSFYAAVETNEKTPKRRNVYIDPILFNDPPPG